MDAVFGGQMWQMWATFGIILIALGFYAVDRIPLETTSLVVLVVLLLLFYFAPVPDAAGKNLLGAKKLLEGFANPALITILALLVIGDGLARTGALDRAATWALALGGGNAALTVGITLVAVMITSAFLNNTPVVVIFIPIMQALSHRLGRSASRLMIPLSYASILGGMLTLIGSSTNLLVSGLMGELGMKTLSFFDFTVPGAVLAGAGILYVLFIAPRMLPDREKIASKADAKTVTDGRQFIARITITEDSAHVGDESLGGFFPNLGEISLQFIQRGEKTLNPPFDEAVLQPGDTLFVVATRQAITEAVKLDPGLLTAKDADPKAAESIESEEKIRKGQMLAEVMITPPSRYTGQTPEQLRFSRRHGVKLLGVQRRSRMVRKRLTEIRLEPGDVLLIQGEESAIRALRGNPDIILMEWSAEDLPATSLTQRAVAIFLLAVGAAAFGLVPIVVAAVCGAAAMIATGCLTMRQAAGAIDRTIVLMIAVALALGVSLEHTGGAPWLAGGLLAVLGDIETRWVLSAFFLLVALLSNVLNTKACAVLFTPIGIEIARGLGVDPLPFAVAVVFAANCSYMTPIGYQTNLLVIAPGNYKFTDFTRAGALLTLVIWIAFTLFVPWYYGL